MRLSDVLAEIGVHTDDAIIVCEAPPGAPEDRRIVWCNPAFTAITGWTAAEAVGRSPKLLAGPQTDGATIAALEAALRAGLAWRGDYLGYRRDGRPIWLDVGVRPVADPDGAIRFSVSIQRDVTARKAHEQGRRDALRALQAQAAREREVRAQLAGLARHAPGALYQSRVGPDGVRRLTYRSPNLAELFGLDDARLGDDASMIIATVHAEDRPGLRAALADAEARLAPLRHEYRVLHPARGERWLASVAAPRPGDRGEVIWDGHVIDITDERRASDALAAAKARAEAASEAKSMFLANMSHEIRTPLNGVLGMAALLERTGLTPEQARMTRAIREAGETLLSVLNDVLDFSRIEADALRLEPAPFALADLARRIETLHALKARDKALGFAVTVAAAPGAMRLGDMHRVLQILHNLAGNALKFTDAGRVDVRIAEDGPAALLLEVADTGPGMTAADAARVFDAFVQADGGSTRRHGGCGLGLAIVRRLAEAMGGGVAVQTAPGAGATFRVRLALPRARPRQPAAPGAPDPGEPGPRAAGLRVLVAEDNAMNREIVERFLLAEGCAVTLACDGAEAVAAMAAGAFDVVLMDVCMPMMDGPCALRRIRATEAAAGRPPTPILAVTAHAMAHEVEALLAAGFDGHVAKPVGRGALAAALRRAADRGRAALAV